MRWVPLLLAAACGGAAPAPTAPVTAPPATTATATATGPTRAEEPAFALTFAPSRKPAAVDVRVRASARPGLERWASVDHTVPENVVARDASGPVPTSWKDGLLTLASPPRGYLELDYRLPAHAAGDVVVSPQGYVRFYGEPLLLPVDLAKAKTHLTVDFDLAGTPGDDVASSFGPGKHVEADLEPIDLSKGAWMVGTVWTARFHAMEGRDDFAWIGYAAFDPRWISAEIATLRTSVSQFFKDGSPPPFTMLLVVDKRGPIESTPISIYPRWRGMFAIADVNAPWEIGARMSVALALVSRFASRLGGPVPVVSGLARWAAREVLLASGTMTPLEYADEINGEIAATLFADKNADAAAVANAALDASRVDALLRKSTKGKRTMRDLLREWVVAGRTVTQKDLADAATGKMPSDAFGKCFTLGPTKFDELDLGFDEQKTRKDKKLTGVRGAAKKAGLREGDELVSIRYDEGQAEHPVRVVVSRAGKNVEVKYRPIGRSKVAQGWRVVPGIDPSTCTR
jgi:hypothetical protein